MRVLVTAASKHGVTSDIATAIAEDLTEVGTEATVPSPESVASLEGSDDLVVGNGMPLRRYAKGLLVLEMLLSVGAIGGGLVLIVAPRGEIMPLPLSALAGSPFETHLGPGLILFAVLGLGPLVAACLVWLRQPLAPVAALICGLALLIWIAVEIAIIGYSNEPPLHAIYLSLGVAITLGAFGWARDGGLPGKRPRTGRPI